LYVYCLFDLSFHKISFWSSEAAKSFRHKHKACTQGFHLFRCHLGLYRPKAGGVHNKFLNLKKKCMEKDLTNPEWFRVSEIELVYRNKVKPSQRPTITSSADAKEILRKIWNPDRIEMVEEFKVLFLNKGNKVLGVLELSSGGVTGTVADPKLVFAAALKANAVHLMLAHNHPSGNLKPSHADEALTNKFKEAARLLDMTVLDHIILTSESYFSFADEGLI
jgi:hypothetical protein